ncbi:hypothetical protein niasHS_005116 [Heterodera schachtii]|uniref:Peptidase A1 domain-containing protein n=1 Tax=Heterodera schachtii TaxID=97005 RepID=A0ABD2JLM7_HETSC
MILQLAIDTANEWQTNESFYGIIRPNFEENLEEMFKKAEEREKKDRPWMANEINDDKHEIIVHSKFDDQRKWFASDSIETYGLSVCRAYFGQANQKDIQKLPFNGILGLALNTSNQNVDPLFIQAYKQGLFKKPLFSLYLATQGNVKGTLGGVTLDDGTPINGTSDAVIDSGTSFLIGPFDQVNNILRHYGVDPKNGTMPCDQKFGPIIFTIHGQEYNVDEVCCD